MKVLFTAIIFDYFNGYIASFVKGVSSLGFY